MDWKNLIAQLMESGMRQAEIASHFDKPQSWVSDILRGRYQDLKWSDGQALLRLHRKTLRRTQRQHTERPHA